MLDILGIEDRKKAKEKTRSNGEENVIKLKLYKIYE